MLTLIIIGLSFWIIIFTLGVEAENTKKPKRYIWISLGCGIMIFMAIFAISWILLMIGVNLVELIP